MFVLNGNSEKVVGLLRKCGLTEYESKTYFTLLLTDREKMGSLSRRSGVPQSKIYWVVEGLESKGLVSQVVDFPKTVSALPLEPYLSMAISSKQKEIAEIICRGKELRETAYALRPVATRFKTYKVFEPKYRRRRFQNLYEIKYMNHIMNKNCHDFKRFQIATLEKMDKID